MKSLKLTKYLLGLSVVGGVALSSAVIATSCGGTEKEKFSITFNSHPDSLDYTDGSSNIRVVATCDSGAVPTLSADDGGDEGEGVIWVFTNNYDGTGVLSYTQEKPEGVVVTITATAPDVANAHTTITLTPHATLDISATLSTINYLGNSIITATSTSGAFPTLSASGDDQDKWNFHVNTNHTGTLTYTAESDKEIIVTITANSQHAAEVQTTVTLTPHDTITFENHAPTLDYTDGTSNMIITAHCTSDAFPSLSASGGETGDYTFVDNGDGTGILTYVRASSDKSIDVTITANSPHAAEVQTTVTLTAYATITFDSHPDSLEYTDGTSRVVFTAHCTSGAYPTLSADDGEGGAGVIWTFVNAGDGTGELTYIVASEELLTVTITAASPYAANIQTTITLIASK